MLVIRWYSTIRRVHDRGGREGVGVGWGGSRGGVGAGQTC